MEKSMEIEGTADFNLKEYLLAFSWLPGPEPDDLRCYQWKRPKWTAFCEK
jgi:hypothetical protein